MKKVVMCHTIQEFENWVNATNIEVISVDIKVVEPNMFFQQGFCGLVFYKELTK